uniref:Uncharacterized protein n=1 Tax=Dicentrarchus labrax TaxID=13489 RepID=A0A8C4EC00_DICLA
LKKRVPDAESYSIYSQNRDPTGGELPPLSEVMPVHIGQRFTLSTQKKNIFI